jgi:BlaI family penicillinase repressor
MDKLTHDVTDAELNVLQVLWDDGPSTLRRIAERLYPKKKLAAAQATVLKLLERLESKECIRRQRDDGPQLFRATMGREALIGLRLRTVAEQLCDGSFAPLLTNLVKGGVLSSRERQELQELLAEMTSRQRK